MESLHDKVKRMLKLTKPIDVYLKLSESYNQEELDLLFYQIFDITFNLSELELKDKRLHQIEFRDEIINKYHCCIISGLPSSMCEACHIIPYCESTDKQKYDINNGLLLEAGIHKLFDAHLISIDPTDKCVKISPLIMIDTKYKCIHQFNNKKINVLSEETLRYLKSHFSDKNY